MARSKRRQLDSAVAAVQHHYGMDTVCNINSRQREQRPQPIGTGFPQLDGITGCFGIPLGYFTLFTGTLGAGKLTVAYKVLMMAQQKRKKGRLASVAILNLNQQINTDYLRRCQVDLDKLDIYQPLDPGQSVDLLFDVVAGGTYRVIVVDTLADLLTTPQQARQLQRELPKLAHLLRTTKTGMVCIGEQNAPWITRLFGWDQFASVRRAAALHIDFMVQEWHQNKGKWRGYRRMATIRKSRWGVSGHSTPIDIELNSMGKTQAP